MGRKVAAGLVAALLAGPRRHPHGLRATRRLVATFPMLALVLCACWFGGRALLQSASPSGALGSGQTLLAAGAGTLLCLALSAPAALSRPGRIWLLPIWLGAGVGAAGWSLIVLPQMPSMRAMHIAVLLLPFMVVALAGAIPLDREGLRRAAAGAGASPLATAGLLIRACSPRVLGLVLAIFVVAAMLL